MLYVKLYDTGTQAVKYLCEYPSPRVVYPPLKAPPPIAVRRNKMASGMKSCPLI
jgi:hypothetical protein